MFDARLRPLLRRAFDPLAASLAAQGATADAVTLAGFGFGVAASLAFGAGAFRLGLALIIVNRLADGLDGRWRGAFLDIALDFAVYALVPLARIVAEKSAGRDADGSVDLIWINGPSFLSLKQKGLLYGPFVDKLPNARYIDTTNKPSNVVDFTVPVEGYESP